MGNRGEAWVLVQVILFIAFVLVPQIGAPWPHVEAFHVSGWALGGIGVVWLAWSTLNLGRSLTPFPKPIPEGKLVTTGAYGLVRHPIYSGIVIAALGLSLASTSWLRLAFTAILFVLFDVKARREELWLQEKYAGYPAYKRRVKKLVPWIY